MYGVKEGFVGPACIVLSCIVLGALTVLLILLEGGI